MGFLHKAINTLFYPAVAAGKAISGAGKKVESGIDRILNTVVLFFQSGMAIAILGGTAALLLLAKNPKMLLLAV